MTAYECRWNQDEFCTNANCPMRGDYCPVPDTPDVCKHEVRYNKFEGMLYRQHRLKVPESVVRGYEELLKYELLSLSIKLDKWVEQGAPIEEKDNG